VTEAQGCKILAYGCSTAVPEQELKPTCCITTPPLSPLTHSYELHHLSDAQFAIVKVNLLTLVSASPDYNQVCKQKVLHVVMAAVRALN